ncbi:hypothetical protein [Flavobacterium hungaricum]|nr:hypothetical protein [Flavobacterium hungaricum]
MREFIKLIKIPEIEESRDSITDYTIFLEQSFSRFGDSDLVIILEYENPEHKKVLFIEGKVKTSQSKKWDLENQFKKFEREEKYIGSSSNLFFQLYLKKLLFDNCNEGDFALGIEEPRFKENRKIGNNKVVLKAISLVRECQEAYYIGLIPSNEEDVTTFSGKTDFKIHFLSWFHVHEFCKKEERLKKVIEIFDYNEGQIY